MSEIVLLAPGAVAPWTEGRKIFVADLADALRSRGFNVHVLNGAPAATPGQMIWNALRELRTLCRGSHKIEAVATFPYGTFGGVRGKVNAWLLNRVRVLCASAGVAQIPVFYSCVGLGLDQLSSRFGPSMAVGRSGAGIAPIHLGIRHPASAWRPPGNRLQKVLFLCGYQKPTLRSLHDVLHERGLVDLLDAGNSIAADDIRLTVAVPFLRDVKMQERLHEELARRCPALEVEMEGEVDPYVLFRRHDVFAFPYRSRHSVFVPTSLLEAMSFGIPVMAADHEMYRALTVAGHGPRCGLYRVGDPLDFAQTLRGMQTNYARMIERASAVSSEVREEWTIGRAVEELLAAVSAMAG